MTTPSGHTTPAKASLTRSHPRHKRNLRHSAVLGVADAATHAIDEKKSAKGTLLRLVSPVVSASWVLVHTLVDTGGVEVEGGGEGRQAHGESGAARCRLSKSRSASFGSVQSFPIPDRKSWPEASPA